jgi:hypothetical protein
LDNAGNREVGAELLCEVHIAAAAGLKIRRMRRSIDRRNIENGEFSGFRQTLAYLLAGTDQPLPFIAAAGWCRGARNRKLPLWADRRTP